MKNLPSPSLRPTALFSMVLIAGLLFGCLQNSYAQNWTTFNPPLSASGGVMNNMYFFDKDTGWIVGMASVGDIVYTTNGGTNWVVQTTPLKAYLEDVFFVNTKTGYAVGKETKSGQDVPVIFKTVNGGQQWVRQTSPITNGRINDVHLLTETEAWSVGFDKNTNQSVILQTTNGTTWTKATNPVPQSTFNDIFFLDATHGWIAGATSVNPKQPIVLTTSDGGQTWTRQTMPISEGTLKEVVFYNEFAGWAVGFNNSGGVILKTSNGGTSWTKVSAPPGNEISSISILKQSPKPYITAHQWQGTGPVTVTVYESNDAGATWLQVLTPIADAYADKIQVVLGSITYYVLLSDKMKKYRHVTCSISSKVEPAKAETDGCKTLPGHVDCSCGSPDIIDISPIASDGWVFTGWNPIPPFKCPTIGDEVVIGSFSPFLTHAGRKDSAYCPSEVRGKLINITTFTALASTADSWIIDGVKLKASGTGDEQKDLGLVNLHSEGNLLGSTLYTSDDGEIIFRFTPLIIPAGSSRSFSLEYNISPDLDSCSNKTFEVSATCIGMSENFPPGVKLESGQGSIRLGCIYNTTTHEIFNSIQAAIDATSTQIAHRIVVCPGHYKERVKVTKPLTIESKNGPLETIVSSPDGNSVFTISEPATKIAGFTISGAKLLEASGVHINGDGSTGAELNNNKIIGNYIGVLMSNTNGCTIGNYIKGNQNIILGNTLAGIKLSNSYDNQIKSNYIGIDANNTISLPNGNFGIYVTNGSYDNIIGQSYNNTAVGNVISGHSLAGIFIEAANTHSNHIYSNKIGTDFTGTKSIPNTFGIAIYQSNSNLIGDNNTISGNNGAGILLNDAGKNLIVGNFIGTNGSGNKSLPNHTGVVLSGRSIQNKIGYSSIVLPVTTRNVISGNSWDGVKFSGTAVVGNVLSGNYIGTDITGLLAIPNNRNGIILSDGAPNNILGGWKKAEENIISGNANAGIFIKGSNDNKIGGNLIGLDALGHNRIPNMTGIYLEKATNNYIGGDPDIELSPNVISGNNGDGIFLSSSDFNHLTTNIIGLNPNTILQIPNSKNGIQIVSSRNNIIGESSEIGNIIGGNGEDGVRIISGFNNSLYLNYIGTNQLLLNLPNRTGISLNSSGENKISNNFIRNNCRGIEEISNVSHNYIINNDITNNRCPNSGIHLNNSNSKITGNTITADEGNAISCNNASLPLITKNNIFNNKGYGLVNQDATVTVKAKGNWWGDPSGPGGKGPGLGDEVSDYVDYGNWHSDPASIVVGLGPDTVYAAIGQEDSVYCFFQNWANLNDILNVNIKADSSGWITDNSAFSVTCADSVGAVSVIHFAVPASVQAGATNKVRLTTVSQGDTTQNSMDSFIIVVYLSRLKHIELSPDTAFVPTGQSLPFFSHGLDSLGRPYQTQLRWTSSCGTIDSSGYFTAGGEAGTCRVTAEDTLTNILATAIVHIFTPVAQIEISPDTAVVRQNSTQSFVLNAYDSASATTLAFPRWTATGGTITSDGLYTAGDTLGYYFVVAEDSLSGLIDTAIVHVTMGTSTDPDTKTNVQTDVKLEQNHPNPFHSFTNILYSLPQRAYITLKVYDLLGNLMAILEDGEQERGTHKVEYRADELPDGIYFYHLRSATHSMAKKMVISK
ncbi:MAG: hypothetical protein JPMHGGIA_00393 [Saprospiraceae bacterium]|nr:hypothetical protein [Saprospiraceae bacterium]